MCYTVKDLIASKKKAQTHGDSVVSMQANAPKTAGTQPVSHLLHRLLGKLGRKSAEQQVEKELERA